MEKFEREGRMQLQAIIYFNELVRSRSIRQAAEALIAEGFMVPEDSPDFDAETGFKGTQTGFIDDVDYDGREPNAYLERFEIGLTDEVL